MNGKRRVFGGKLRKAARWTSGSPGMNREILSQKDLDENHESHNAEKETQNAEPCFLAGLDLFG